MGKRQQSGRGLWPRAIKARQLVLKMAEGVAGKMKEEEMKEPEVLKGFKQRAALANAHASTPSARRRRRRPSTAPALRVRRAAAARPAGAHLGDLDDLAGGQVVHPAHDLELALLHQALQHGRHLRGADSGGSSREAS